MQDVTQIIEHYGLAVVFLSVLLDKAGLPIPSYPVLLVAGALSVSGGSPALAVLAAAVAGGGIADLFWYGAGAKFGRRALSLVCRVSLSPDSCVRQTETVFSRTGPWALVYVKFIPGLRYVSVVLSGISRVSLPLFVVLDGIGNALYFSVALFLGWLFRDALDAAIATLVQLGAYGIGLVLAGLALYLAIRWIERQNFIRQLKMDRISVKELMDLVDGGHKPIILDVRPVEARVRSGMIPGAVGSAMSETVSALKDFSRDAEIVIYCSCPNEASAAMAAIHLKRAGFKRIRPLLGGIEAWIEAGRPIEVAVSQSDGIAAAAAA